MMDSNLSMAPPAVEGLRTSDELSSVLWTSYARAFFRLLIAAVAFAAICLYLGPWLGWLTNSHRPQQAWVTAALELKSSQDTPSTQASDTCVPPLRCPASKDPPKDSSLLVGAQEHALLASFAQKVLAAFVIGTFVLMGWLTRELFLFGQRQLRSFFRELERIEHLQIVRVRLKIEPNGTLDDLAFGLGEQDDPA
jgi:hypothetical protein